MTAETVETPEYESKTCSLVATLDSGHKQAIESLTLPDKDQSQFITTSRDRSALCWDVKKRNDKWAVPKTRLTSHNHFVSSAAYTNDSSHIFTSSWDSTIHLWKSDERRVIKVFKSGGARDVLQVVLAGDGQFIISISRDKESAVSVWNINGECKKKIPSPQGSTFPTSVSVSPHAFASGKEKFVLAVSYLSGIVVLYTINLDSSKDDIICKDRILSSQHQNRATSVKFSPDGSHLFTAGADRKLNIYKLDYNDDGVKKDELISSVDVGSQINQIATHPTISRVACCTRNGVAFVDIPNRVKDDEIKFIVKREIKTSRKSRNNETKEETRPVRGLEPKCCCYTADGTYLYVGYSDGSIRVWQPAYSN